MSVFHRKSWVFAFHLFNSLPYNDYKLYSEKTNVFTKSLFVSSLEHSKAISAVYCAHLFAGMILVLVILSDYEKF